MWIVIPDFPDYAASSNGEVIRRSKGLILKPFPDKNGHMTLHLYREGKSHTIRVHKIIAQLYVPNDNPLVNTDVSHKDRNKENNCADNLFWSPPANRALLRKRRRKVTVKLIQEICQLIQSRKTIEEIDVIING